MRTNLAGWERVLRVVLGASMILVGALWFSGTETLGYRALAIAAAVLGLDFTVTGAIGFCPLYHKLGWRTAPARQSPKR